MAVFVYTASVYKFIDSSQQTEGNQFVGDTDSKEKKLIFVFQYFQSSQTI